MTATLILGAPGTGKTERVITAAVDFLNAGGDPARLLVLTPTRAGATRVRDELARRIDRSMSTAPLARGLRMPSTCCVARMCRDFCPEWSSLRSCFPGPSRM